MHQNIRMNRVQQPMEGNFIQWDLHTPTVEQEYFHFATHSEFFTSLRDPVMDNWCVTAMSMEALD